MLLKTLDKHVGAWPLIDLKTMLADSRTSILIETLQTLVPQNENAFSFYRAKVWNESEHEVKLAPSLSILDVD